MRLLVLSDLHLEHRPRWSLRDSYPPFDVAVFAGDVAGSPAATIATLAAAPGLRGRPIAFVPGNHEFYNGAIEQRLQEGRAACSGTAVHMLDRTSVVIDGVRFTGAILWTDYKLFGDPITAQVACLRTLNDHRMIETAAAGRGRVFLTGHAMARHEADRLFIEAELARPFQGKTVVVTHHAPHRGSVHKRYEKDPTTAGFASDLTEVIVRGRPDLWIHGHMHNGSDYSVGTTRIICNPKGYGPSTEMPRIENDGFDDELVVEI